MFSALLTGLIPVLLVSAQELPITVTPLRGTNRIPALSDSGHTEETCRASRMPCERRGYFKAGETVYVTNVIDLTIGGKNKSYFFVRGKSTEGKPISGYIDAEHTSIVTDVCPTCNGR